VSALAELGRVRLSPNFFLRDFLFSDIAAIHGLSNVPDDPDLAIHTGSRLCVDLLEPLQATFGRIAIRSAYRSAEVNALGNASGDNCASNATDAGLHIWDLRDATGRCGAMACVVLPSVWDRFHEAGEWRKLAWYSRVAPVRTASPSASTSGRPLRTRPSSPSKPNWWRTSAWGTCRG
jgi:hypothetical protein